MKWLGFVLGHSRGPRNALHRLPTILQRFGITARRSELNLQVLMDLVERHDVRPTLPVTAVTAQRHPAIIQSLQRRGAEIAAHGYVHNDYASLSRAEQVEQVRLARTCLESLGLSIRGWRCPYSRWNGDTLSALASSGMEYDATPVYHWPAYERESISLSDEAQTDYQRFIDLSSARNALRQIVLPTMVAGLVQIPMSIPQDEDMVDRLHLDASSMARVWIRMLHDVRDRGEIFVMCLHPERTRLFAEPLEATLTEARRLGDIWIASCIEVAEWWRKRDAATIHVSSAGSELWRIEVNGPETLETVCAHETLIGPGAMIVAGARKPVIGFGSDWPVENRQRLRDIGFFGEQRQGGIEYGLDLDSTPTPSAPVDEVGLVAREHAGNVVRVRPWPTGYRSCLSITADIDALTLYDFAMRFKEF